MAASPRKLQILIVEDHRDTSMVLKLMLESMGHSVNAASTLRAGRAVLRTSKIDVAFSDIRLSDGMGWDLLRGLTLPSHFFAIAMSGYVESYRDEMRQAGFCRRIDKPFSTKEIMAALQYVVPSADTPPASCKSSAG